MTNPRKRQPSPVDRLLQKLAALPPMIDLIISAVLAAYGLFTLALENARVPGYSCLLIALIFAVLGISTLMREMRMMKFIEAASNPETLRSMRAQQFESYLMMLFALDGYSSRLAIDEVHRQDDADLILTHKKQTILLQFNHFDEDWLGVKPIQSLQKGAAALRADRAIAVTLGQVSEEALAFANRKGVELIGMEGLLLIASRVTGTESRKEAPVVEPQEPAVPPQEDPFAAAASDRRRFLFVDFSGLDNKGMPRLVELLQAHPSYAIVATSLPANKTLDDVRQEMGFRQVDQLDMTGSSGPYFAIQRYLQGTPEGRTAPWLVLDSNPRAFPDGTAELVAINKTFGFDQSAVGRLVDAMTFCDRRAVASFQCTN